MRTPDERVEELIAAAVAGDLTPSEHEELDRLRREHAWIDDEIDALRGVAGRVDAAAWIDPIVTEALRERILGELPVPESRRQRRRGTAGVAPRARRTRWLTPLLAAACLAVGLVIGLGSPALLSMPPTGPPGTLGAVEPVQLAASAPGIDLDIDLVAHTWGTEAVVEVTGLEVGATYAVVFIGADGTEFSAGEMLGSHVPIHCRLNAAVLREDAVRLEVRDERAAVIASAGLPDA